MKITIDLMKESIKPCLIEILFTNKSLVFGHKNILLKAVVYNNDIIVKPIHAQFSSQFNYNRLIANYS